MITKFKIFEYKVSELIKDKEVDEFFRKVKSENPDEYNTFVSLVGNKGLAVAKEKYKEFDPEEIKLRKKKEKIGIRNLEKEKRRENKEKREQEILNKFEPKIKIANAILNSTPLKSIEKIIKKDKNISEFLDSYGVRKRYKNLFAEYLQEPFMLEYNLGENFNLDSLSFNKTEYDWLKDKKETRSLIKIVQRFNFSTNKLLYSIYFSILDENEYSEFGSGQYIPKIDRMKEEQFLKQRNAIITKLQKVDIDENELLEILNKFSYIISNEVYQKWKEKFELEKDATRYNL